MVDRIATTQGIAERDLGIEDTWPVVLLFSSMGNEDDFCHDVPRLNRLGHSLLNTSRLTKN